MSKHKSKKLIKQQQPKIKSAEELIASAPEQEKEELSSLKNQVIAKAQEEARLKAESERKTIIDEAKKDAKKIIDEANEIKKKADDEINAAKKDAETIRLNAEKENKNLKEKLEHDIDEYGSKLNELNKLKENYRIDIKKEVFGEEENIHAENENLHKENTQLKKALSEKESDLKSYQDVCENYGDYYSLKSNNDAISLDNERLRKSNEDLSEKNAQLESILSVCENPQEIPNIIETLKEKIKKLEDQLENRPTEFSIAEIKAERDKLLNDYENCRTKCESLLQEKNKLEEEYNKIFLTENEIEMKTKMIKCLELQFSELKNRVDEMNSLYENTHNKIFANLSEMDRDKTLVKTKNFANDNIDLKTLCDDFRGYMNNRSNKDDERYYSDEKIRTFIAGFATSRIMILEGLSGTGKSSLPKEFAKYIGAQTRIVPVQSSWNDRNDLLGFYNDFKKQYKETPFLKSLYAATIDGKRINCIVLDEMNLSRIEYYFADFLSVLEDEDKNEWKIELVPDHISISNNPESWPEKIIDGKLQIGANTWFIGTANKDDSTSIITDKVYDRSVVIDFQEKGKKVPNLTGKQHTMDFEKFNDLLNQGKEWKKEDYKEFKELVKKLDAAIRKCFDITFGNRICKQLKKFVPVYVACGGTVDEAIDVIFATKIIRKIEGTYDQSIANNLDKFKDALENFKKDGKIRLPITIEKIKSIRKRL